MHTEEQIQASAGYPPTDNIIPHFVSLRIPLICINSYMRLRIIVQSDNYGGRSLTLRSFRTSYRITSPHA